MKYPKHSPPVSERGRVATPCAALDRALDVLHRHVGFARLLDPEAESGIRVGVGPTTIARGDGDFTHKLGE